MSKILKVKITKVDAEEVANKPGKYENFTGKIDFKGSKGNVQKANFSLYPNGFIDWNGGTWVDGVWQDGIWDGGKWLKGTWKKGTWADKNTKRPDLR